jgi:branched-chain amino acid transport system substrate-binding protein
MTNVSASVGAVLKPAGLENSKDILSAGYQMDVTDPQWDSYPGMQKFRAFMAKYYPEADRSESGPLNAFNTSTALVEVLKRCGDNLTRDNVMKIVANLDFEINTYIPGIRIKTSPTDFYPIEQVQMMKFTGEIMAIVRPDHRRACGIGASEQTLFVTAKSSTEFAVYYRNSIKTSA